MENKNFAKSNFNYSKLLKNIIIAGIALIILIILIAAGQILFLLQIFGWIENQVRSIAGTDVLVAKGIAALLISLLLILPIWGFIMSFLPVPQKHKKEKRLFVFVIFALLCFASYFSSKNVYFDVRTGEPMKYYSISPTTGEYNFSSSSGFDRLTGDKMQKINRDVIVKYLKSLEDKRNGLTIGANNGESAYIDSQNYSEGAEKYAKFYPVKFLNQSGMTMFLCISTKLNSTESVLVKLIPNDESVTIKLFEGKHIFAYMDASGDCYGRVFYSDDVLNNTYWDDWFKRVRGPSLPVQIETRSYELYPTFYLTVLPKDDLTIKLMKKKVKYSY